MPTAPTQTANTMFDLPSDAQLLWVEGVGFYAVFDVGGASVAYTLPIMGQGGPNIDPSKIQHVSSDQFNSLNVVQAGDAEELRGYTTQFGTYKQFFDQIIDSVMPASNGARTDAGVLRVLAEFAGRPDMSMAELQNKLQSTEWFQARTQTELEWNNLATAEQQKRRESVAAQMQQAWFQFGGVNIDPSDPRVANYLEQVASGKMGFGAWTEQVVKVQALQDANSPWSRTVADEEKAQKQSGIDVENTAARVRDLARRWGVQWSQGTYQDWASRIVSNDASEADVLQALKDQAQVLYAWKSPDIETMSAASPWIETYNRVMEKQADLFDPKVQQALTAGTPVWEFEQSLKKSGDWLNTKNAREEMTSVMSEAGRRMGFA
jgi:hypothetical protein